jgi:hypothetical protein
MMAAKTMDYTTRRISRNIHYYAKMNFQDELMQLNVVPIKFYNLLLASFHNPIQRIAVITNPTMLIHKGT